VALLAIMNQKFFCHGTPSISINEVGYFPAVTRAKFMLDNFFYMSFASPGNVDIVVYDRSILILLLCLNPFYPTVDVYSVSIRSECFLGSMKNLINFVS
jgi:hypothetical protein